MVIFLKSVLIILKTKEVIWVFRVQNDFKNANLPRTIRFTEELFERLHKTAAASGVSFNALVLQCCKYALDNMDGEGFREKGTE